MQHNIPAGEKDMKDTDSDWAEIAATEPYFGVLTDPAYLRGNINDEALERFWESGRRDIEWQLEILESQYGAFKPRSAIDFGCGVGRLTRMMATVAEKVYGIDVAPGMLEIARKNAPQNTIYTDQVPDVEVDWINSLIVFQHIHPSRGTKIIADLVAKLCSGGAITLHVTIGREMGICRPQDDGAEVIRWDGEHYRPLIFNAPAGGMTMYDYDLGQLMVILNKAGIHRLTVQHTNHGGHYGVILIGKKA
ncbi:MAG: class I SAM-dependent methyltransferase [Sphingomonadales bacterium]|jgi:SAM-dependent methyltransferase|nr:MAG: class I SAM-dependent methyltransferase [Alphaproteobacteria bacterium]TNF05222.1 MAG: class I SAM-dependent methyltransferase [Sphingomonadales bacterium]